MATAGWRPTDTVATRLLQQTHAFDFGQALALLQKLYPHGTPPGTGVDPRQETVRLNGPLFAVFPVSALGALTDTDTTQPQLQVNVAGLGGPDGPLPYAWQEWLQQRWARKDYAAVDFLNLFHQRLLGELYRAEEKYRAVAAYAPPVASPVYSVLRALTGLLPQALHEQQALPDAALLARTGILANRRRSIGGFKAMVHGQFGLPVRIAPFEGAWSALPASTQARLGAGRAGRLEQGRLAGRRVWDEHAGIRITLGPLALAMYRSLLPGQPRYISLMALAAFYFGRDMRITLALQLQRGQLPPPTLGKAAATRLGWLSRMPARGRSPLHSCVLTPAGEAS